MAEGVCSRAVLGAVLGQRGGTGEGEVRARAWRHTEVEAGLSFQAIRTMLNDYAFVPGASGSYWRCLSSVLA